MRSFRNVFLGVLGLVGSVARGDIKPAALFADHMVLQQGVPVAVWGAATPGEKITVRFSGQKKSAQADAAGHWLVRLAPLKVSTVGHILEICGNATREPVLCRDVLVGEVWICGGQSNMVRTLGPSPSQQPIVNWEREVAGAQHPMIRQFLVPQRFALAPEPTPAGHWLVCSPATAADFTAVGYFFARDLQAARGVPVGLIDSAFGGTAAEGWMSAGALAEFPEFSAALAQVEEIRRDPANARRVYQDRIAAWYRDHDPGSRAKPWSAVELETSAWETMALPVAWEEAGHPSFDGVAWFRRSFELPVSWIGRELTLRLSAIDEADTTWVNGVQVGATYGAATPRAYQVPAAIMKPSGNVVAVRVLDTGGRGGIWNGALPLDVAPTDGAAAAISLRGPWRAVFSLPLSEAPRLPLAANPHPYFPSVLYNAMIAPLVSYAIRGVVFYQGESNATRAAQYRRLLPALIADWRRAWGEGDFPFLFVQVAPFRGHPPEIREAQLQAWQATPNTAMVVTIDCGAAADIHPADKEPVGVRLALAARAVAYGDAIEYSGPVWAGLQVDGQHAVLSFAHLGGGLVAKGGALHGFTVAGTDGVFHPAQAEICGDTVRVIAADVAAPAAVRYAWANVPEGNLFNAAGLPASPFRTDPR